jgi:DNA-binding transcriptional LysR family regulator
MEAAVETVDGKLRLSAPYEFAAHHLGAVACRMLERYCGLEIDIDVHYDAVDLIDRRYDIVFTAVENALPDSSLVARRIFHLQRGLFAAPDFVARHGRLSDPASLSGLPVIASLDDAEWLFHDAAGATCTVALQPRMRSPNAALRLQAAIAGIGVARITASYCERAVLDGRLQRLLPDHVCDPLRMYALLPGRERLPARVRVFLKALLAAR